MPELPEVETLKTDFTAKVVGDRFRQVSYDPNFGNGLKQATKTDLEGVLPGKKILDIQRVGKYLILGLENNNFLTFHLKIYGRLLIDPSKIPFNDPVRVTFLLTSGKQIKLVDRSNIASIYLLDQEGLTNLKSKHGPDPFTDEPAKFHATLADHRSLVIKEAILKPSVVEGVGNIYADEALFLSGINPKRKAGSLSIGEQSELYRNIKAVLEQGIKYRGTSIESWYDTGGIPGENQKHLFVYGQENKPCPTCKNPIQLIEVSGRRTYFCPIDQPEAQLSLF